MISNNISIFIKLKWRKNERMNKNKFYKKSIYPNYKNKYIITIFTDKILNLIFIEFNILFSYFKNYFFYFNIAIFITKIIIYSRSSSSYKSSKSERKDYS